MHLSKLEIDVATVASKREGDYSLEQLLGLAETAFGLGVTLLVDGALISGDLAPDRKWGERLDEVMPAFDDLERRLVTHGWEDTAAIKFVEVLRSHTFAKGASDRRQGVIDHFKKMEEAGATGDEAVGLDEIDEELAREEITQRADRSFLTLLNAEVKVPPATPLATIDVGTMRVLTAHIGAWWPGRPARQADELQ